MRKNNSYYRAIKCVIPANQTKVKAVSHLISEYSKTMHSCLIYMDETMQKNGEKPAIHSHLKPNDIGSKLSARYVQTAYSQARGVYISWLAKLTNKIRSLITCSSIEGIEKTILYRINARHMWYVQKASLDWKIADGIMVVPSPEDKVKSIIVPDNLMKLSRRLMKRARKLVSRPNLLRIKTMILDYREAIIEPSRRNTIFPYWIHLSTMIKGKPISLPIKRNPYFDKRLANGKLLNSLQVSISENNKVSVAPIIEYKKAPLRTSGRSIGLDWGVTSLFSSSEGRMVGRRMLDRLKELDAVLTDYTAELQRNKKPLKKDARYRSLHSRISSYVKNEVGRVLNRLADEDVREIVVERLNFRGGGLSKRMNRIVSIAGRHEVEAKLARLRDERGVSIVHVDPAYTSQECSRCGYVNRKNRKSQSAFKCLCCGHVGNADVNAALNILGRSRDIVPSGRGSTGRKTIHHVLLDRHAKHCPSGNHVATAANIGAVASSVV